MLSFEGSFFNGTPLIADLEGGFTFWDLVLNKASKNGGKMFGQIFGIPI